MKIPKQVPPSNECSYINLKKKKKKKIQRKTFHVLGSEMQSYTKGITSTPHNFLFFIFSCPIL